MDDLQEEAALEPEDDSDLDEELNELAALEDDLDTLRQALGDSYQPVG